MANNFNSNNFYFDKSMYLKDKNNRINTDNFNLSDEGLIPKNPDEYQFQFYDRFDTYKGLFNTQQFIGSIDFDNFANHCFFDSAVSKTEYAFNTIYDKFPFDGTKQEIDDFFKNIDGFTKTIYNKFDKNIGYLRFNNSYVSIQNKAGYIFSSQRNEKIEEKIGNPVLNPDLSSFAIDFRCYIENINTNNTNQVLFQYLDKSNSRNNGFTLYIKDFFQVGQKTFANIVFLLSSNDLYDSVSFCKFFVEVQKWQHIIISVENINNSNKKFNVILNEVKTGFETINFSSDSFSNNQRVKFENFLSSKQLNISNSINFNIGGNGTSHSVGNTYFNLIGTIRNFKGYIDEFRFYHSSLDENFSIKFKEKNVYSTDALKLYFRFNEPAGLYTNNSLVFDHSGNSLHSRVQFSSQITDPSAFKLAVSNLRDKTIIGKSPLKFEEYDLNPVIIPSYDMHITLNEQYLEEATAYDKYNPNLIFKLFPRNYFLEGAIEENFDEVYKNENTEKYYKEDTYDYPGRQKKEAQQAFANILVIWARFFDQLKLYLQVLPKMIDIEYSDIDNKASAVNFFIPLMAKLNGFDFKEILNSPTNKILDGYILGADGEDKSQYTLRFIQNEIWKRILINSRDIITSKGTKQSIRSIFNSVGIIPEDYYRFREFGTNSNNFVDESNISKNKNLQNLKFKGSTNVFSYDDIFPDADLLYFEYKINTNKLTIKPSDKFLFNNPNSNYKNLNIEFFLNYDNSASSNKEILIESILKIEKNISMFPVYYELIFIKESIFSKKGNLYLFCKKSDNSILKIDEIISSKKIENIDLMDGSYWHFSLQFSKQNKNTVKINVQRAGFSNQFEKIYKIEFEVPDDNHIFNNSQSVISFGSRSSYINSSYGRAGTCLYANELTSIEENYFYGKFSNSLISYDNLFENYINFNGNISFFKLWKSYTEFDQKELISHAKNPFSISCNDLLNSKKKDKKINDFLMFDLNIQEKLIDTASFTNNIDFPNITISSCNRIIDYSQNSNLNSSFEIYRNSVSYDLIKRSTSNDTIINYFSDKSVYLVEIDTKFDEINELNKVNIGGFISNELADKENVEIAPVHFINQYLTETKSDSRFSIEMSSVKHLNEDISNLFSNLEYWSNNLSNSTNLNEISYIDFEKVRDLYFQRITSVSLNMTPLYEIYQIFDNILTELLNQFIASRIKFNNNIYVIESHSLERHKYYYKQYEAQAPLIGNFKTLDGQSWTPNSSNSKRNINYLNKEGRILRDY
jgi:hypothetical protein